MFKRLYWINAALLATHEVDSAYWKEWSLFHLPFGLAGFLLVHVVLFALLLWGYEKVVSGRPAGLWASGLLAIAGIVAISVHGFLLLGGGLEFRAPVSILLLGATGLVSAVQLAVCIRSRTVAG